MSSFAAWKRLMVYLKPYWFWALLAFLGMVASNGLMVIIPTILRDVIDLGIIGKMPLHDVSAPVLQDIIDTSGFEYGNANYMLAAGFLVIGLGVLRGISGFIFRFFGERLSHFIAYDMRNEVYQKIQTQSFTYHDESQIGTLITRAISDVDEVQRFFAFGLMDSINTALLIGGVSLVMVLTSPALGLIALIPLIPLSFFSRRFAVKVDPMWKQIMERLQTLGNYIQENALGAEVVRAFNREDYEIQKFSKDNEELYRDRIALIDEWGIYLPLSAFIIAFSTALVLFFGGWMEQNGINGVTVGLVVAFNAYVLLLAQPVRFLGFVILLITQAIGSSKRVFEILDEPTIVQNKPNTIPVDDIAGNIKLENVTFTYSGSHIPTLKDINFEASPGQVVALIGLTGAGKSSLISLISRFYDVTAGRVLIDGHDVRDLHMDDLRQHIGVVLQSSLLFSETIRDNIRYGKPDASEEEIIAAAKAADAHNFIVEFPEGYDTLVGERGVTLSGGQKQRVAIARALLINPRILILDDSTSSVDTRTEYRIRQALERIMRGRTTFVIAQRLSSVQDADLILVMKDGEIIERGKHEDLLAMNGLYKEIYDLQLADQDRVRQELMDLGHLPTNKEEDRRLATDEFRAIIDRIGGD